MNNAKKRKEFWDEEYGRLRLETQEMLREHIVLFAKLAAKTKTRSSKKWYKQMIKIQKGLLS